MRLMIIEPKNDGEGLSLRQEFYDFALLFMSFDIRDERHIFVIVDSEQMPSLRFYEMREVQHVLLCRCLMDVGLEHVAAVVDVDVIVHTMMFRVLVVQENPGLVNFVFVPISQPPSPFPVVFEVKSIWSSVQRETSCEL